MSVLVSKTDMHRCKLTEAEIRASAGPDIDPELLRAAIRYCTWGESRGVRMVLKDTALFCGVKAYPLRKLVNRIKTEKILREKTQSALLNDLE